MSECVTKRLSSVGECVSQRSLVSECAVIRLSSVSECVSQRSLVSECAVIRSSPVVSYCELCYIVIV